MIEVQKKNTLLKVGKIAGIASAGIAVAGALYNYLDPLFSEGLETGAAHSASGKFTVNYRDVPHYLARSLDRLPNRFEDELKKLPIGREECNKLLQDGCTINVTSQKDALPSADFARVQKDGTIQINGFRLTRGISESDHHSLKADLRCEIILNTVLPEVVSGLREQNIETEVKYNNLPPVVVISSDLRANSTLLRSLSKEYLTTKSDTEVAEGERRFEALSLDNSSMRNSASRGYDSMKLYLERCKGFECMDTLSANSMMPRSLASVTAFESLSADWKGWPKNPSPVSISSLISRRRTQARTEASTAGSDLLASRLAARNMDTTEAFGTDADSNDPTEGLKSLYPSDLEIWAREAVRLSQPITENPTNIPSELDKLLKNIVDSLDERYRDPKELKVFQHTSALECTTTLIPLIETHYSGDTRGDLLQKLRRVSITAVQLCGDSIVSKYSDGLGENYDTEEYRSINVVCQSLCDKFRDASFAKVAESYRSIVDTSLGVPATRQLDPYVEMIFDQRLSVPSASILRAMATSDMFTTLGYGMRDHGTGPTFRPNDIERLVKGLWFRRLSVDAQRQLLVEITQYEAEPRIRDGAVHADLKCSFYDPSKCLESCFQLEKVTSFLPSNVRDAGIQALLTLPVPARMKVLVKLDEFHDASPSDDLSNDGDCKVLFARYGVLFNAIQNVLRTNSEFSDLTVDRVMSDLSNRVSIQFAWPSNTDLYTSSLATQTSWGGTYQEAFSDAIQPGRTIREVYRNVSQKMEDVEVRISRGESLLTNAYYAQISHDEGREQPHGLFRQRPDMSLGTFSDRTTPSAGLIIIGHQFNSDNDRFMRGAEAWRETIRDSYGIHLPIERTERWASMEDPITKQVNTAIQSGKTDEFLLIVNAHGSSSEGGGGYDLVPVGEGAMFNSSIWVAKDRYLNESELKRLVAKRIAPYFKRVTIIFDSCESGGWTN